MSLFSYDPRIENFLFKLYDENFFKKKFILKNVKINIIPIVHDSPEERQAYKLLNLSYGLNPFCAYSLTLDLLCTDPPLNRKKNWDLIDGVEIRLYLHPVKFDLKLINLDLYINSTVRLSFAQTFSQISIKNNTSFSNKVEMYDLQLDIDGNLYDVRTIHTSLDYIIPWRANSDDAI